jgi:hypothetical protein
MRELRDWNFNTLAKAEEYAAERIAAETDLFARSAFQLFGHAAVREMIRQRGPHPSKPYAKKKVTCE